MKQRVKFQFLSGSSLKVIAMLVMLIDHTAAALVGPYWQMTSYSMPQEKADFIFQSYMVLRSIGRTAFPIFCFLLIEGFFHTKNRKRYAGNLFLFALLSELPFDYALFGQWTLENQNVYFTLLIGLLVIWAMESANSRVLNKGLAAVIRLLILFTGFFLAYLFRTDYSFMGVILIVILYFFHDNRILAGVCGYLSFCMYEVWCFPAFLLMQCYNGKRGWKTKYLFYFFYPGHLFLLAIIRGILI